MSNTQTYSVSSGVVTNIDNLYRFSVTGVNSTYSTSYTSTSGSTTISGARDLTSITAGGTASSLTLIVSWTSPSPSYTGSYLVSSSTDGVSYSTLSETTSTYAYLFSAVPGTTYYFKVVPYTGGLYSGSVTGYAGNASTTSAPTVPSNTYNGYAVGGVTLGLDGSSTAVTGQYYNSPYYLYITTSVKDFAKNHSYVKFTGMSPSDLNGVFWQVFRAADRYSFYILNPAGSWNSSYTNLSPSGTVQAYERTTPYGGYLYWSAGANTTSYAVIIYNDTDSTNSGEYITSNTYFYLDRKSTRLNSSHIPLSRMPSSA